MLLLAHQLVLTGRTVLVEHCKEVPVVLLPDVLQATAIATSTRTPGRGVRHITPQQL